MPDVATVRMRLLALHRSREWLAWQVCNSRSARTAFPIPWRDARTLDGHIDVRICDDLNVGRVPVRPCFGLAAEGDDVARRRTESGTTMFGRSIAVIGVILCALAAPVAGQAPAPADRESSGNDQAKPSQRTPPTAAERSPQRQPRIAPPARSGDEFDPLPSPGCQYRDNKLDLLV